VSTSKQGFGEVRAESRTTPPKKIGGSQRALVDLAHGVASDRVDDVDRAGALVSGQPFLAPGDEGRSVGRVVHINRDDESL